MKVLLKYKIITIAKKGRIVTFTIGKYSISNNKIIRRNNKYRAVN